MKGRRGGGGRMAGDGTAHRREKGGDACRRLICCNGGSVVGNGSRRRVAEADWCGKVAAADWLGGGGGKARDGVDGGALGRGERWRRPSRERGRRRLGGLRLSWAGSPRRREEKKRGMGQKKGKLAQNKKEV
ncbi:hypothetical protein [Oryza sativa Japonica Group]|uniref:Uncharacterized protein n=1 Tax=Oryza sativa subsp. japonica TaxID=39947 RepID=Q8LRC3_ORYSJ|nr:hypothetical protein [Oryza sativa Japonica Group]